MNALKVRPDWQLAREMVVCSYQALGQVADARAFATRLTGTHPAGDVLAPLRRSNPQWNAKMQQLLRDAGAASSG